MWGDTRSGFAPCRVVSELLQDLEFGIYHSHHRLAFMSRILLVEDETSIADTLIYALETEHFEVIHATTGGAALEHLDDSVQFAILDVGLPDMSGFDLCSEIRQSSRLPVLFLTARDSEVDRILGLELGGDDYVTKPFSPREVVARVRAILRRSADHASGNEIGSSSAEVVSDHLLHDQDSMTISCHGQALNLTAHEYKLLATLMTQPGRIFTREQLLEKAWEDPGSAMDRTVDAHVKSLRAKLRAATPDGTDPIETRRGLGYTLAI